MKKMIAVCVCAVLFGTSCSQERAPDVAAPAEPASAPAAQAPASTTGRYLDVPPQWATAAAPSESLSCFLDVIEGKGPGPGPGEVLATGEAHLLGWSVDKAGTKRAAQKNAVVRISSKADGKVYFFTAMRSPRPDVEAAPEFSSLETSNSGVISDISLAGVEPGAYEVSFVMGDEAGASACSFGEGRVLIVQ